MPDSIAVPGMRAGLGDIRGVAAPLASGVSA